MRKWIVGLSLVAASPAFADQATDIVVKAAPCWSMPSGVDSPPMAEFDVVFDKEGFVTDAKVTKFTPSGEPGKRVVMSAVRALENCGPYPGAAGTIHVVMDPKTAFGSQKPINPFK